jgi:hypothetical protein
MKTLILLTITFFLFSCAWTERMNSYEASLSGPHGEYQVVNKHGALLIVEESDGSKVTSDDRGHPEQPGWFSQLMGIMATRWVLSEDDD